MIRFFGKMNPFSGQVLSPDAHNRRRHVARRPSVESLEQKLLLTANVNGDWDNGTFYATGSGYADIPDCTIEMYLYQTGDTVQGVELLVSSNGGRIVFNLTGTVTNDTFTFQDTSIYSNTLTQSSESLTALQSGVLSIQSVGSFGTMSGSWSTSTHHGDIDRLGTSSSKLITTFNLTASTSASVEGQSVTFTATASTVWGLPLPTGPISFVDSNLDLNTRTLFGTVQLNTSGIATITTNALPVGRNSISAFYDGNSNYDRNNSSVGLVVNANTSDIAMTSAAITPNETTVNATYTITGSDLPSAGTIDFYWASAPNTASELGSAYQVPTETAVGTYTASTLITNLGPEPANAKYILAVADSPSTDPAHNFVSVAAPEGDVNLDSTNIVYSSVSNSSTINFTYNTINDPKIFTIGLYQSPSLTFNPSQDTLLKNQTVIQAANSPGKGSFTVAFTPRPAKPYLLVVVNPTEFVQQSNGNVHELPAYLVSISQLQNIMSSFDRKGRITSQLPLADAQRYIGPVNEAMEQFQIDTPKRMSAFLAEIAAETGDLRNWSQSGTFSDTYERGRGPIQLTHKAAYVAASIYFRNRLILTDPDIVADKINHPEIGFGTAGWFWVYYARKNLNTIADTVDTSNPTSVDNTIKRISLIVNGGTKGLDSRTDHYRRALTILHA